MTEQNYEIVHEPDRTVHDKVITDNNWGTGELCIWICNMQYEAAECSDSSVNNRQFITCSSIDSLLLTELLLQPDDYGSLNEASH